MDCEKYSLRQREKRRLRQGANTKSPGYNSDNSSECLHNIFLCQKTSAGANAKLKTKAAPLSKYRRKTANARERTRMREINSAFENLRHCVPACITSEDVGPSSEKLTKITTLRLAMKYIKVLSEVLLDPQRPDYRSICDSISYRPSDKAPNDSKRRQREKSEDQKPNAAKTSSVVGKRRGKKGKLIQYDESESTLNHPRFETSPASNSSSAYASLSPSYESSASPSSNYSHGFESNIMGHNCNSSHCRKSTSDLSTFMLESDGESLNPSERWPSPLRSSRNVPSMPNDLFECSPSDMPSLENPLELSLRLMEPPTDSVAFSPIRVPCSNSPCLAPLMNFESFDLFHPDDIGDHGALDLFLT